MINGILEAEQLYTMQENWTRLSPPETEIVLIQLIIWPIMSMFVSGIKADLLDWR